MRIIPYPSPNFNSRPPGTVIDMIILHYTDMLSTQESLDILTDPAAEVSSHYLVDTDGSVYALVDCAERAWHAGKSAWEGQENLNHNSIGIEIQNPGFKFFELHGRWCPYPDEQIDALIRLIRDLQSAYPIPDRRILGHSDICPGRKLDPGPHFPWHRLRQAGMDTIRG